MKRLAALFWLWVVIDPALAQTPYFQGKTIRIVTGYPAGDVNDMWPRLITQHMGKYIPGNPIFIVQNMPGASSMIAANYVASVAKPDGLTLGWIAPTLYFDQLVGRKEVQYDWGKYTFIGSPSPREHLLYMRRLAVSKYRRYPAPYGGAQVRFRRRQRHGVLLAEAARRNPRHQI
jgi:tripartite-type tricarboxylate transporter receptor subunit TctC